MKLTVYYDEQFWVGVVEQVEDGQLKACRYIFGPEPQDAEILDFVNRKMLTMINRATQTVEVKGSAGRRVSPKRLAREAAREVNRRGVSTAAQEAIKHEYESRKMERKQQSREEREAEAERKRLRKIGQSKAKHRGH